MAKRRANGEGSVSKRADGRWEGRIIIGRKENGRPIYKSVFAKTQKELMPKLRKLREDYEGIELTPEKDLTLAAWMERWLREYAETTLRPGTVKGYRSVNRCYLIPSLGDKRLLQLNPEMIQRVYNEMQSVKSLSNETVRGAHMVLHEALEAAVHEHLIPRNPTNGTTLPRKEYAQKQILNNEQLDRFLQVIKTEPAWYDFFYTEITTGLRRGEICGLRWEDLDSVTGQLSIRRSVHPGKDGPEIGETKTEQGKRMILLPASTLNLLRNRKMNSNSPWIFQDPRNPAKPVSPNAAYQKLKALLKKAELPSIRFHDLRHTFATHALQSGVDAKTLSGILGHTDASFTLDTYTHVTNDMQQSAAKIVGSFMEEVLP